MPIKKLNSIFRLLIQTLALNLSIAFVLLSLFVIAGSRAIFEKIHQVIYKEAVVNEQAHLNLLTVFIHTKPKIASFSDQSLQIDFTGNREFSFSPKELKITFETAITHSHFTLTQSNSKTKYAPLAQKNDQKNSLFFAIQEPVTTTDQFILQSESPLPPLADVEVQLDTQSQILIKDILFLDDTYDQFPIQTPCQDYPKTNSLFSQSLNGLSISSGTYTINQTIILPKNCPLTIAPGTTLKFASQVSLITYSPINAQGTSAQPILFTALNPQQPWGVVGIVSVKEKLSQFSYVTVENGDHTIHNGVTFTAALAAHSSDILIDNSTFRLNHGDDALNVKNAEIKLSNSLFTDNDFDGVDVDRVTGLISNSRFFNNGDDAIDTSFSVIEISNNDVSNIVDKCISIGERSEPNILENRLNLCGTAIAVKDESRATISNTIIANSSVGIALYRKKEIFNGAQATLHNISYQNNKQDVQVDEFSKVENQ